MKVIGSKLHRRTILTGTNTLVGMRRHFTLWIMVSLFWIPSLVHAQQR
jgi:hypothetical protein